MKSTIQNGNRIGMFILFSLVASMFLIFAYSPKSLQAKAGPESPEEEGGSLIQKLDVSEEEERTRLTIQGTGPMVYTVFKSLDHPRIVVDIHNADLGDLTGTIEVENGTINNINSVQFDNKAGKVSRIEIGLDKMVDYEVVKDTGRLIIYVNRSIEPEATSAREIGTIENIDFKQMMGKSRIIVSTSHKARYDLSRASEDTLVLELAETDIPRRLQERLDIEETNSAVKLIKPYETTISGGKVSKIAIKLKTMVPYHVLQEKNTIYLDFDQPPEALSKEISATPASAVPKPEVETTVRTEQAAPAAESATGKEHPKKKYTGKKISMDFKDADIKNLFRLIAEVSNLNLVAGDDVTGTITIKMVNVPWDQALDVILTTNNLEMVREGSIIRIAPAGKFRKQEELEELATEIIYLNYAVAKDIKSQINTSARGKISADERTNSIIITDIKRVVKEAKEIARNLDTPTRQVLIEARIVQSSPIFTRELGIQWGGSYSNTAGAGDYTISGTAASNYAINLPASTIHGGLGYGFVNNNAILDLKLTAMEKDEKVKIISRPKIVTLDNKKAKIEQGVDIPYVKMTEEGTVSTEFKKATLSLEVTPHITPDGSIIMNVLAKKDQVSLQTGYAGQPGIDTRSAETNVLVKDGETTVIGGIYERTQRHRVEGVPFFSKIPVLGWLFRNKYEKDEVTELLIFITPTIVKQKPVV